MPGLFQSISSAIRCISKSSDCDFLQIEGSTEISSTNKVLDRPISAKSNNDPSACCYEQLATTRKQQSNENFRCEKNHHRSSTKNMSDSINNNCPNLQSKERKGSRKIKKSRNESQLVRVNSTGHKPAKNKQDYPADKTDLLEKPNENAFSKFNSATNNPHLVELSRQSSVSLPVVYTPPRIMKWPNHSSFREGGSKSQFEKSALQPPPNRTILKNDGRYIVSVSRRDIPCEKTGFTYVMERQFADKQQPCSSEDLTERLRMDGWCDDQPSSSGERSPRLNNQGFSYLSSSRIDDPPPEYSDPPDYYAVV